MDLQLQVQYRPTAALVPDARNARTHSRAQVKQLARSMRAFGFINPILIGASGSIIAGHARLLAAHELGLSQVPVIQLEHLSETQRRAYMLADNRLAEQAGWDTGLLRIELSALASIDLNFDVELTGFSTPDIDVLLGESTAGNLVEPAEPPPPAPNQTVTRLGDVWQLGPHRLLCADVRNLEAVQRLLGDKRARMVLTDPPYNVPIDGHASGLGKTHHPDFAVACGELDAAGFTQFLKDCLGNLATVTTDGGLHYVFMDWRHLPELLAAGAAVYAAQLNLCVWTKTNGGMGSLYRSQHELVGVFKVGRGPHVNNVELGKHGRYRTNVWQYAGMNTFTADRDEALRSHPTVKPIRLVADAILDVTRRGDLVLDGFMGSGTTLLAAEQVGRVAYGLEIEPRYVDVAIRRWQDLTGESARLDGGMTFDEVAADRLPSEEAVGAR